MSNEQILEKIYNNSYGKPAILVFYAVSFRQGYTSINSFCALFSDRDEILMNIDFIRNKPEFLCFDFEDQFLEIKKTMKLTFNNNVVNFLPEINKYNN